MTAPKRRWFQFWDRFWTALNYPITSREFDERLERRLEPSGRQLMMHQILVAAVLVPLFWFLASSWLFWLFVVLASISTIYRWKRHRRIIQSATDGPRLSNKFTPP